jgi:hypothetical protein
VAEGIEKLNEVCIANEAKINDTEDAFNKKRKDHKKKMEVAKRQAKFYLDQKNYVFQDLKKLTELLKRAKACRTWAKRLLVSTTCTLSVRRLITTCS